MRPLRWSRLWLGVWIAALAVVVVLSLVPPPAMAVQLPRHADKVEHFLAYAALAAMAVQLFASRAMLLWAAIGLATLGIVLEVAQGQLVPEIRQADWRDAVANTLGVIAGFSLLRTRATHALRWLEARLSAGRRSD